jgi:hypothetical protein
LELFFVQVAKHLERTFNGKSESCLCGGKAAINTVFVELPDELTKEISSFMNFKKEKCSSTSRVFKKFCEVGAVAIIHKKTKLTQIWLHVSRKNLRLLPWFGDLRPFLPEQTFV